MSTNTSGATSTPREQAGGAGVYRAGINISRNNIDLDEFAAIGSLS